MKVFIDHGFIDHIDQVAYDVFACHGKLPINAKALLSGVLHQSDRCLPKIADQINGTQTIILSDTLNSRRITPASEDKVSIIVKFQDSAMFICGSSDVSILKEVNSNLELLINWDLPSDVQMRSQKTARLLRNEATFVEVILAAYKS